MNQQMEPASQSHQLQMGAVAPNGNLMLPTATGANQRTPGLEELLAHCFITYPNQRPICESTNKIFVFHGGDKPLDFVYIFRNEGDPDKLVPRHWHYVGFGLSDIHRYQLLLEMDRTLRLRDEGYANIVPPPQELYPPPNPAGNEISGFGFELTFRVRCHSDQEWASSSPPEWPIDVMQALARYVFRTKNVFSDGDHTSWVQSLDREDSRIEHILMTLDPQFGESTTEFGRVRFIQIVGVCQEELEAAQHWKVEGILNLMRKREETGGNYLVTDMRRGESLFQLDPESEKQVMEGIKGGSDLAMISARHKYSSLKPKWFIETELLNLKEAGNDSASGEDDDEDPDGCRSNTNNMRRLIERTTVGANNDDTNMMVDSQPSRTPSRMSLGSESNLRLEFVENVETRFYDNMYLLLEYESAKVLPVVINGRLGHKNHFSFQSPKGDLLTTFVPEDYGSQSLVSRERPIVRKGPMLQIYVSEELRQQMWRDIQDDFSSNYDENGKQRPVELPRNYSWPDFKLHITVVKEIRHTPIDVHGEDE